MTVLAKVRSTAWTAIVLAIFLAMFTACSSSRGANEAPSGSSGSLAVLGDDSTIEVRASDGPDASLSGGQSENIDSTEPAGEESQSRSSGESVSANKTTLTTVASASAAPDSADSSQSPTTQAGDGILLAVLIIATDGDLDRAVADGLITEADIEAALEAIASGDLDSYIGDR